MLTANEMEECFVALVGERILHRTMVENCAGILSNGLIRPDQLAALAGVPANSLALREDRVQLTVPGFCARLNHQRPLLAGRNVQSDFLDGHTIRSWAENLDGRLFFWPEKGGDAFGNSLNADGESFDFVLKSRAFFRRFGSLIDLSPINSGNARRKPARRGDWLYVNANDAAAFRYNRRDITGKQSSDQVCEISLRADIAVDDLIMLLV